MRKHFIWMGLMSFCLLLGVSSCGKKEHLTLTKDMLSFHSKGGVDFIQVIADCEWTLEKSGDWFSIGKTSVSHDTTTLAVTAKPNTTEEDREGMLTFTTAKGTIRRIVLVNQSKPLINEIVRKVWFTRTYERWDLDYQNEYIPESYRMWTYYTDPGSENWFWYFFEDTTSYQIHTYTHMENHETVYDTVFYPLEYTYYPEGDSIYINFTTVDATVEDYHAIIHQLDENYFVISDAYRPHQYEKITNINVTGNRRGAIKINPKKVRSKPAGPMITVK